MYVCIYVYTSIFVYISAKIIALIAKEIIITA